MSKTKGKKVSNVPLLPHNITIKELMEELERRGMSSDILDKAKEILSNEESRTKILDAAKIDKPKIEKATEIKSRILTLTNEIVALRYRVNEASKIMGKRLFEDNSETSRISNQLWNRQVIDQDSLHVFIDDLHKYIIQSGNWDNLYKDSHIEPVLKILEVYRNSFDHIYDMKGGGTGSEQAYKKLGEINEELFGHKVIKIEEYPLLQIEILERVKKMLTLVEENVEEWLK